MKGKALAALSLLFRNRFRHDWKFNCAEIDRSVEAKDSDRRCLPKASSMFHLVLTIGKGFSHFHAVGWRCI